MSSAVQDLKKQEYPVVGSHAIMRYQMALLGKSWGKQDRQTNGA